MRILAKSVTADAQVVAGDCYFVGAELSHTTDTNMILYNENSSSKTAAKMMATLKVTDEVQHDSMSIPIPGVKCEGIYAAWTAGIGTVYYYR